MPGIDEASGADTPLGSDLAEGVKAIAIQQEIKFTHYAEAILPLDNYRFWVRIRPLKTMKVMGSLHYATEIHQDVEETFALNRVVFTSLSEVTPLNAVDPKTMWIGEFDGLMFGFSGRGKYFKQSGLHHYYGAAIYPDMRTQVVNSASHLATDEVIASNSLPLWLAMNAYQPPVPGVRWALPVTLYPAYLLPLDMSPPFASVDILQGSPIALQSTAYIGKDGTHFQLVSDRVKITMFGLRNAEALTLVDAVNQYSLDYDTFGIMNMPVVMDERRIQPELMTIAQKKSVEFEISYHQFTARNIARQLITKVINNYFPQAV